MILDGFLMFSNGQVLTASADSTNVLDFQNARDLGVGENKTLKVFVATSSALLSAGATTLDVAYQGSTDGSTWTTMWSQTGLTKASITAAGTRIASFDLPRPVVGQALPRYAKLVYTVGTGPFTAGSVSAGIVLDDQANVQYAAGLTVNN
jgi:hypothetical protein